MFSVFTAWIFDPSQRRQGHLKPKRPFFYTSTREVHKNHGQKQLDSVAKGIQLELSCKSERLATRTA